MVVMNEFCVISLGVKKENQVETDRGSYYNQEKWLEEFLDDKGAFCKC